MVSHPDMQEIRIIGFFFENRLNWQFELNVSLTVHHELTILKIPT